MTGSVGGSAEKPAVFFATADELRAWFTEHAADSTELWLELRRAGTPDRGITWEQAVQEALCVGWIDSRAEGVDEIRRRQRFTPRRPTSNWSAVNIALMATLQEEGRMTPAGLAVFEARDRTKDAIYSYEQPRELSAEFAAQLAGHERASAFWQLATPSYRRVASGWVMSAKREATMVSRLATLIDDCAAGRLIPSQRYGAEPAWVGKARQQLGMQPSS